MNILIIGNGFDLAHGLPTRYSDFLNSIKERSDFYQFLSKDTLFDIKIFNRVKRSIVLEYMKKQLQSNDGWIDFENELKEIIDSVCGLPDILHRRTYKNNKVIESNFIIDINRAEELPPFLYRNLLRNRSLRQDLKDKWSQKEIHELENTIRREIIDFISLFKEYIVWINECQMQGLTKKNIFEDMSIDHLLSFNYTPTFLKLYNMNDKELQDNICFVHGKIDLKEDSEIVMGIGSDFYDENKHEKYVDFFKFFQCYKYSTSTSYLKWIENASKEYYDENTGAVVKQSCKVYVYGHSLDPTDKNILKPFLDLENSTVYIYYMNESNKEQLEHNLLKILGKELFSNYLMGEHPKVQFIQI